MNDTREGWHRECGRFTIPDDGRWTPDDLDDLSAGIALLWSIIHDLEQARFFKLSEFLEPDENGYTPEDHILRVLKLRANALAVFCEKAKKDLGGG